MDRAGLARGRVGRAQLAVVAVVVSLATIVVTTVVLVPGLSRRQPLFIVVAGLFAGAAIAYGRVSADFGATRPAPGPVGAYPFRP